ncbi:uncharacterized protein LOC113396179 [Vanessa tameamea]|uniref:Uncharacterized protein LOC113396179 n=1 Tax=Vanessa tameamea TaxID=334116 RepID=A0ABM4AM71_VANTA
MKFSTIFVMLMAVLALFADQTSADPKSNIKYFIRKGGRVIKKGFGFLGAAATAHEIYNEIRNRNKKVTNLYTTNEKDGG